MNRLIALLPASVVVITLVSYAAPAAADAARFLEVPAWQGRYWLRHHEVNPHNNRGEVDNSVVGVFLLDEREGRNLWLGTGSLTWRVEEWQEGCIGLSACTITVVSGEGDAGIDDESDLEIDVWSGSYELYVIPEGWYDNGPEVFYEVTLPGRIVFDDGGPLGLPRPRTGSATNEGPASLHAIRPESLQLMFDDPLPLPPSGLMLCGRKTRDNGTEMGWKVWPAGQSEPDCPEFERE
jgi:hypothetical protein